MLFRDVIGHRKLVALLSRSIDRGSLPPSLIFAGPEGIGKRTLALAAAQAVNCLQPWRASGSASSSTAPSSDTADAVAYDACGVCAACKRIARGVHPDVIVIAPGDSGSIKIEPVRDVIDRSGYRPFEGRRRVVIVDEADAMVFQAQNALLKTLEEPPSASMFILISSRPDALLPTVRSRCPRLRFSPLSADHVAAALVKAGRKADEATTIAATAEGSIGRVLHADAGDLIEARDVAIRVLQGLASSDDPSRRIECAKALLAGTGGSGASDRERLSAHLHAMSLLLRDIELLALAGNRRDLANPGVEAALERLTAFSGERGVQAFAAVDRAIMALTRNAGVKIVADWVALAL